MREDHRSQTAEGVDGATLGREEIGGIAIAIVGGVVTYMLVNRLYGSIL